MFAGGTRNFFAEMGAPLSLGGSPWRFGSADIHNYIIKTDI
jgi:hypothetical protein